MEPLANAVETCLDVDAPRLLGCLIDLMHASTPPFCVRLHGVDCLLRVSLYLLFFLLKPPFQHALFFLSPAVVFAVIVASSFGMKTSV